MYIFSTREEFLAGKKQNIPFQSLWRNSRLLSVHQEPAEEAEFCLVLLSGFSEMLLLVLSMQIPG